MSYKWRVFDKCSSSKEADRFTYSLEVKSSNGYVSFSKNMKRIFEKDNIFVGIEKIQNEYIVDIINSKDYAAIFYPDVENNKKNGWQGRLCWDIPFMCSYNKININKKNNYLYLSKAK